MRSKRFRLEAEYNSDSERWLQDHKIDMVVDEEDIGRAHCPVDRHPGEPYAGRGDGEAAAHGGEAA